MGSPGFVISNYLPPMPALHTPLCDLLGCRYPLMQAPMAGGPTTPELVAAVSEAGGFGVIAAGRLTTDQLHETIRAVRRQTTHPFGVNFLLAPPEGVPAADQVQRTRAVLAPLRARLGLTSPGPLPQLPASELDRQLDLVVEERVPMVSTALGDPAPVLARLRSTETLVLVMVTTPGEARRAAAAGAAGIIAQGAEAGGHRSSFPLPPAAEPPLIGTLALVPQVVDAVPVPVIASGGIADGRGVAAALALGAVGVSIGTRFLLCRESGAFPAWKARVLGALPEESQVTRAFTGRPARGVANLLSETTRSSGVPPLPWPWQSVAAQDLYQAAAAADDAECFPLLAGQVGALCRPDQGGRDVVRDLVEQAVAVVERLGRLR
jgi:nitronate monooxygenase